MKPKMTNNGFTKEEFWGKAFTTDLWLFFVFGSPMMMVYAIENYPLENENHPIYWQIPTARVVMSFILCILFRKKTLSVGPESAMARMGRLIGSVNDSSNADTGMLPDYQWHP